MSQYIKSTGHKVWRWGFAQKLRFNLTSMKGHVGEKILTNKFGKMLVSLDDHRLTIYETYTFDGCTCAPDFDRALLGCGVHDALLQILDLYPNAYPDQWAHDALREIHNHSNFSLAPVYHWAVSGLPRKIYKLVTKD